MRLQWPNLWRRRETPLFTHQISRNGARLMMFLISATAAAYRPAPSACPSCPQARSAHRTVTLARQGSLSTQGEMSTLA